MVTLLKGKQFYLLTYVQFINLIFYYEICKLDRFLS